MTPMETLYQHVLNGLLIRTGLPTTASSTATQPQTMAAAGAK